jgi:hypothetical protein
MGGKRKTKKLLVRLKSYLIISYDFNLSHIVSNSVDDFTRFGRWVN